jgi:hypothetical protein
MLIQPRDLFMLHEGAEVEVIDEHVSARRRASGSTGYHLLHW